MSMVSVPSAEAFEDLEGRVSALEAGGGGGSVIPADAVIVAGPGSPPSWIDAADFADVTNVAVLHDAGQLAAGSVEVVVAPGTPLTADFAATPFGALRAGVVLPQGRYRWAEPESSVVRVKDDATLPSVSSGRRYGTVVLLGEWSTTVQGQWAISGLWIDGNASAQNDPGGSTPLNYHGIKARNIDGEVLLDRCDVWDCYSPDTAANETFAVDLDRVTIGLVTRTKAGAGNTTRRAPGFSANYSADVRFAFCYAETYDCPAFTVYDSLSTHLACHGEGHRGDRADAAGLNIEYPRPGSRLAGCHGEGDKGGLIILDDKRPVSERPMVDVRGGTALATGDGPAVWAQGGQVTLTGVSTEGELREQNGGVIVQGTATAERVGG